MGFASETQSMAYELVKGEYLNACKVYGKRYNSEHEGYAILKEEMEEALDEIDSVKEHFNNLWQDVKSNNREEFIRDCGFVEFYAIRAIEELAQVGAVARKMGGIE